MQAKVHAARVFDRVGIKSLMKLVGERFSRLSLLSRLSPLWLDAGYNVKGTCKH
jgi:hypothetical protein